MATSGRNHGTDQEPNGINGGAPPSAAREAEAAVYAGLALDLYRGFGLPTTDRRPNHLTSTQPLPIMLLTCKRCIRTGVNYLSGLYRNVGPYQCW
jgi:hypothetical protein